MSRKKKKKQKKLIERTQDQEALNGWNCSADVVADNDDDDDDDDYDMDDDETGGAKEEQPPRPQMFHDQPEPQVWVQPSLDIPAITPESQPEPVREVRPEPVREVQPEPVREARPEPVREVRPEPVREVRPEPVREVRPEPVREVQPEPVREVRPEPVRELQPEHTREVQQEQQSESQPMQSDNQQDPDVGNLAEDIKGRVADRLSKSKDDLFKLFTQPRKPQNELEEDIIKFGGLDDEPGQDDADEPAKPGKLSTFLQKVKTLRLPSKPKSKPKPRAPVQPGGVSTAIVEQQRAQGPAYPAVRYATETYIWGYTECYYIGIQVLRNLSDLRRRAFGLWMWTRYYVPHFIRKQRRRVARVFDSITDSCLHPFRDITEKTNTMRVGITNMIYQKQEHRVRESFKTFFHYLYTLGNPINRIASFVLPILGCAVLASVVIYFQNINYALSVEYSGMQLGYVAREGDFYEAKSKVYDRLINEEYAPPDDSRPTFRLVITTPDNLISTEALANKIMSISKNEVAVADGIYIDGAFLGAVEDGSEFLFYIDSILDNYRTSTAHERVQFVKKVGLQRGMYPISSIRPVHEIKNALESNETLPQTHKVGKEETLATIAEKNNTTVEDIIELNSSLLKRSEEGNVTVPSLFEGEEILVNKVELSLGIQVIRREEYTEEIPYSTEYTDDNKELENYVEVLSYGKNGERQIIADITYIDGERTDETIIERNVLAEPVPEKKVRGTLKPSDFLPAGGGDVNAAFIWPVAGGYISAGLYGYAGHTGMDIAAPQGTGIYAGRSGTVTYASNRNVWPYGKRVNIDHGGGVTSLYAHCSEVVVQPGQYVKQGQLIAKVGRTGNASGNHCHLEIRVNGRIVNPATFIS